MILKNLKATNAANFDDLTLDFVEGITLINGENLAGKSSILDIISFAIFGVCRKAKKIEYLKKRGSSGDMKISITFVYKDQEWVIEKKYGKREKIAELFVDKELKASGLEKVDTYIQENFIPEALFKNSNMMQQGDSSSLLQVRDTEKFNICKKILELHKYQKLTDRVKQRITLEEENTTKLKKELEMTSTEFDQVVDFLSKVSMDEIVGLIDSKDIEIKSTLVSMEELNKVKSQIESSVKDIDERNKEIQEYNKSIEELEWKISSDLNILQKSEDKLKSLDLDMASNSKTISDIETDINSLNINLAGIKLERVPLFDVNILTDLKVKESDIKNQIVDIKNQIEFVSQGICPTCKQKIENINIEDLTLKKSKLEESLKEVQGEIVIQEDKRRKVKEKEDEFHEAKTKRSSIENSIALKNKEIDKCNSTIVMSQRLIDEVLSQKVEIEKGIELAKSRLKNMSKKDLIDLSDLDKRLGVAIESADQAHTRYESLIKERDSLLVTKHSISSQENKHKELELKKDSLDKSITKKLKLVADLKEVRLIFEKQLPLYIVLNKLSFISNKANDFLHKIFDKYDISFEAAKDALAILFKDNVSNLPSAYENLSGFESGLGGLSVRMGFSLYNTLVNKDPINCVFLDEVDSAFSDKNSELLFKGIFQLKSLFKQIIMVTHKPSIKELIPADKIINIVNNGVNSFVS